MMNHLILWRNVRKALYLALFLGGTILITIPSSAQTTAFSYQGRLNDGGSPASGIYDFTFTLYASSNAISSSAGPVTNLAVLTTNGLFLASVDFGSGVFAANSNYLAVAVRTNGGGAFTTLSPRQPITSAPYAIYAAKAASAVTATSATLASSVAASNVSGTIADVQLTTNIALRAGGNTFSGNQTVGSGRVGIGTSAPGADLHVVGTVNFNQALIDSTNSGGTWLNLKNSGTGGRSWDLVSTGPGNGEGAGRLLFYNAAAGANAFMVSSNNLVGINTTTPDSPLTVAGYTHITGNNQLQVDVTNGPGYFGNFESSSGGEFGISKPGFEYLGFNAASGASYFPNGNVGIGTKNIVYPLTVYGSAYISGVMVGVGGVTSDGDLNCWGTLRANFGAVVTGSLSASANVVATNNVVALGNVVSSGNVMVNSTNYAVSSQENLRIVRGVVNYDGTLGNGAGYTVTKFGTGVYQVNFKTAFSTYPIVTITPVSNGSSPYTAQLGNINSSYFTVGEFSGAIATDATFTFIAIGN